MQERVLATFQFLLAVAGAAALTKLFVRDLCIKLGRNPYALKPFSCSLCMGFWYGMIFRAWETGVWLRPTWDGMKYALMGAAFSWIFYWKITGEN